MRLLSRNAEALFWLARYLERAASLARVIEMQSSFGGQDEERTWSWLLKLYADEERFRDSKDVTTASIIAFYVTDLGNPGSIRSSIHWARENARALRPFIPLEMWVQLNSFHASVEVMAAEPIEPARLPQVCSDIRTGCLAQLGITEGTLFQGEGYIFFKLGLMIERADQTSRLLDVKFAQASLRPVSGDPAEEFVFWSTILRTAAAYQVFNRLETGQADPERVGRFLIHNPRHPRAIGFCVRAIGNALHELGDAFQLPRSDRALEAYGALLQGLEAAEQDPNLSSRLHQFNDWIQSSLITLAAEIDGGFFRPTSPEAAREDIHGRRGATQIQSQQQS